MIKIRRISKELEGSHKEPKREKNIAKFQLAKMRVNLRNPQSQISQVHYSTCENFRSYEPTCEILKAKFRKSTSQLAKIFTTAKHLLGTSVPFRNFKIQFCNCKSSCEPS